jgi:predicted small integral membrane protein
MKYSKPLFTVIIFFVNVTCYSQNFVESVISTDLSPDSIKLDFEQYDKKTAIYCAQISEVAYWDSLKILNLTEHLNTIYKTNIYRFELIKEKKSGTQVLLWGNSKFIMVAFRGTEFLSEIKDIIADLKLFRYYQDSGFSNLPAGHGGFRRCIMNLIAYQDIFSRIRIFEKKCNLEKKEILPVYTTGHSLGAALATMFIAPLSFEKFHFSGCYNFAPPLAISLKDTAALSTKYHDIVYDIVNYLDYIPRAGSSSRKYLAHFGKFYRICQSGVLNEEDEKRNNMYVSHPWRTKFRLLKFHRLAKYLSGLKNNGNSNAEILRRKSEGIKCF